MKSRIDFSVIRFKFLIFGFFLMFMSIGFVKWLFHA